MSWQICDLMEARRCFIEDVERGYLSVTEVCRGEARKDVQPVFTRALSSKIWQIFSGNNQSCTGWLDVGLIVIVNS